MRSAALLLVVLAACSDPDDSLVVDLGVITTSFELGPSIEHPAVVQSGANVSVTVLTYGDDCTWVKRTDVEVTGLTAVIRPFDESAVESLCGDAIFSYRHTTSIRFEQAGTATITVFGYEEGDRFGTVVQRSSTLEVQ
jgi:hypothetical protein